MYFGMKGVANLRYVTGELDGRASGAYLDLLESLTGQPVGDRLNVGIGRAVELSLK